MNIRIIFFAVLFALSSYVSVLGQQTKVDQPPGEVLFRKFDEIRTLAWPDLMARLDNVAINFQRESPGIVLYLIAYAGPRACVGQAHHLNLRAKNYLVAKHGVVSRRVILMDGGYLEKPMLEVWMLASNISPPDAIPNIDRNLVRLKNCTKRTSMRRRRA